jgi:hypothetical protein
MLFVSEWRNISLGDQPCSRPGISLGSRSLELTDRLPAGFGIAPMPRCSKTLNGQFPFFLSFSSFSLSHLFLFYCFSISVLDFDFILARGCRENTECRVQSQTRQANLVGPEKRLIEGKVSVYLEKNLSTTEG